MTLVTAAGLAVFSAGCAVLGSNDVDEDSSSSLSWQTLLVGSPEKGLPRLDPEVIRPAAQHPEVSSENLLEVTVWELFEPNKPHTFPVRVAADGSIGVPLLDPVPVQGLSLRDIEQTLADEYRRKEILVAPRVLVRSLDEPTVRISVAGAVQHPGFFDLPRREASVYMAILAAGGPRKSAGVHVGVARAAAEIRTAARPSIQAMDVEASDTPAALKANASGDSSSPSTATTWFDLTRPADREALRELVLGSGDELVIKPSVPPVRIGGEIVRPGPYTLPVTNPVTLWEALDMAGGPKHPQEACQVVLIRPAGEGRGPQRWTFELGADNRRPDDSPVVQPGDVIHLERTTGSSLQQVVGRLWK